MRIITGKYKGRRFDVPRTFKARPTTDFAKENIFNVLGKYLDFNSSDTQHPTINALDLFSGTGSISLEMLSRGCDHVTSVELDREHARFISECVRKTGAENHTLIRGDVFRFIKSFGAQDKKRGTPFDLIFADPPYQLPELPKIPDLIFECGLLAPTGVFVFEHGKHNQFANHPHFREHRAYGSVNFSIFTN